MWIQTDEGDLINVTAIKTISRRAYNHGTNNASYEICAVTDKKITIATFDSEDEMNAAYSELIRGINKEHSIVRAQVPRTDFE